MPTLEEILKSLRPDAIDEMKSVADKSDLSRLLSNPMSSEDIDSINSKPDMLDKMNRAAQGDFTPPKPIEGMGETVGEAKSLSPDTSEIKNQFLINKNRL